MKCENFTSIVNVEMLRILTVFCDVHQRPLLTGSIRVTGPIMLPTATHCGSLIFQVPSKSNNPETKIIYGHTKI